MKQFLHTAYRQHFFYGCSTNYAAAQLDIFRIGMALYSIFSFVTLLLDYHVLLAPNGLINWEVTNASAFWFELHPLKLARLTGMSQETTMLLIIYLYLTVQVLLLIGLWTRISAIIALVLFVMISNTLTPYGYGVDVYHTVNLLLLCIFPTGYYFSVRPKAGGPNTRSIREISIRALQIYIGLTYLNAGVEKAFMPNWWNGRFIFYLINDPTMIVHNLVPTNLPVAVYAALGISVVVIESLYIFLVWVPVARTFLLFGIIIMHAFIAYSMGLTAFGLLLILLNIICWYPALYCDFLKLYNYGKKIQILYDADHLHGDPVYYKAGQLDR